MRIIAGTKRGKKITAKIDSTTRPTTDRVRENMFNVLLNLIDINGAKVLDLFAGCGAYGLESYSRGAKQVIFNDHDLQSCGIIKKNCKECGLDAVVLNLDYVGALERLKTARFDIIFLDPPYQSDFALDALKIISIQRMLSDKGIIVIETEKELQIPNVKFKKYGRALLYFLNQDSLHEL